MNLRDLEEHCKAKIKDHPELKDQIIENYKFAVSEVEEGGSESHECELTEWSIQELIENG